MESLYCVVYKICGIHHRYRCFAKNAREARRFCRNAMNVKDKDIVEIYTE